MQTITLESCYILHYVMRENIVQYLSSFPSISWLHSFKIFASLRATHTTFHKLSSKNSTLWCHYSDAKSSNFTLYTERTKRRRSLWDTVLTRVNGKASIRMVATEWNECYKEHHAQWPEMWETFEVFMPPITVFTRIKTVFTCISMVIRWWIVYIVHP